MFENKSFTITLDFVENDNFDVPNRFHDFIIDAVDIEDCVRKLDQLLYKQDVTGHLNDFSDHYSYEETRCRVTFGDADCGLQIQFNVEEK